jgi:hypothetical protein
MQRESELHFSKTTLEVSLVVRNLVRNAERRFSATVNYAFNGDGTALVIETRESGDSSDLRTLKWLDLTSGRLATIWTGHLASAIDDDRFFDPSGEQLTFLARPSGESSVSEIWYFQSGMASAELKGSTKATGLIAGRQISDPPYFSRNGKMLAFARTESGAPKKHEPGGRAGQCLEL